MDVPLNHLHTKSPTCKESWSRRSVSLEHAFSLKAQTQLSFINLFTFYLRMGHITRLDLASQAVISAVLRVGREKKGGRWCTMHLKCIRLPFSQAQHFKDHRELLQHSGKTGMEFVKDPKNNDFTTLYFILREFEPLGLRAGIITVSIRVSHPVTFLFTPGLYGRSGLIAHRCLAF